MKSVEFEMLQQSRLQAFKLKKREVVKKLQALNRELGEMNKSFKEDTAKLLELVEPGKARKRRECYSLFYAFKRKLEEMDHIKQWNLAEAEVKFNKQEDIVIFEIAIPAAKEDK